LKEKYGYVAENYAEELTKFAKKDSSLTKIIQLPFTPQDEETQEERERREKTKQERSTRMKELTQKKKEKKVRKVPSSGTNIYFKVKEQEAKYRSLKEEWEKKGGVSADDSDPSVNELKKQMREVNKYLNQAIGMELEEDLV